MSMHGYGALLLGAAVVLTGCENTREGIGKDAEQAAPKIERAAEQTAQAARQAGREIAAAAGPAVDRMREGARDAAEAGDAARRTAQIKAALMADAGIDSTTIDIDTDGERRTVTLTGYVRSEAEKAAVARIATDKAGGYAISNQLDVRR
jgi:osmotically-inducible protein OsmY